MVHGVVLLPPGHLNQSSGYCLIVVSHILPLPMWVFSGFSVFLPLSKNMLLGGFATQNCPYV